MEYVLGFIFSDDRSHLILIRKERPVWQKGKINGIGGKIEVSETPLQAMGRECQEETGLHNLKWEPTVVLKGQNWTVHCFRSFGGSWTDLQKAIAQMN